MMAEIKSEFRKLFTVRSTYFIFGFCLILLVFFGFYVTGWRIDHKDLLNPGTLANGVSSAVTTVSVFAALVAVLLVTHEYRYNTIMYTLTASNNRSKVLLAKILVISSFALVFAAFFGVLSPIATVLGVHAHNLKLVPQTFHYSTLIWQCLFYGWGYSMAGLIIAALIRNQVGAIITLFIAPGVVEGLLSLLLKNNTVYLPFSSLSTVIGQGMNYHNTITPFHAALVFCVYLVVGYAVTWFLFLRRDAN
jgi:ABC-type transport system involved in multi-copper enzyme maturation permease subunit